MDNPSTPLGYLAHAALYWCTIFLPISIGLFLWQIFAAALLFGRKGLNWAVPASIKSLLLFSIAAASLYPGFGFYSGDTHPGHPLPAPAIPIVFLGILYVCVPPLPLAVGNYLLARRSISKYGDLSRTGSALLSDDGRLSWESLKGLVVVWTIGGVTPVVWLQIGMYQYMVQYVLTGNGRH